MKRNVVKYSPTKRKWSGGPTSPISKRIIGAAATHAANYFVPGAGNVIRRVRLARKAFGKWKNYVASKKKTRKARGVYHTTGSYQGKFKKGGSLVKKETPYANKGVVRTSEVCGIVADINCIYITHTAVDPYKVIEVAVQALVRKLFERQGYRIANIDTVLGHIALGDGKDWQVELTRYNGKTGVESQAISPFVTVVGSTVRTVAAYFIPTFMLFSSGTTTVAGAGAAANDERLFKFVLYGQDFNVTRQPVFENEIRLEDEIMHVYGCSEIKIQNRTLAASGTTSTEDISNNPLVGRSYMFNTIPKMRDKTAYPLSSIPVANGVQLVRAAQMTGNTTFNEPPLPQLFTNVQKCSKIRLEPGAIKSSKCSFMKSMSLLTFLERIKLQYGGPPGGSNDAYLGYQSMFPCEMFALEDLINVNPTQQINCAYEANQVIGVYCTSRKPNFGVTTFDTVTYNNVVA